MSEKSQVQKAKEILSRIIIGVDPVSGEVIARDSFLNDPDIIRCLYFITGILDGLLNGVYSKRSNTPFQITAEQKREITLPEGKIGVNEFARCVNSVLDICDKKLTGTELNKRLKQMNILSENKGIDGKKNTVINDSSYLYGFDLERRSFNGREYDQVMINDSGKKYLMENLERIMGVKIPA